MKYFFASRTNRLLSSPLRDIREMSGRDYFISLAEELPAEELFPFKLLEEAAVSVFSSGPSALQYGEPAGYTPLRVAEQRLECTQRHTNGTRTDSVDHWYPAGHRSGDASIT
jgi:DNA-binding transcriptional MocR family regulator